MIQNSTVPLDIEVSYAQTPLRPDQFAQVLSKRELRVAMPREENRPFYYTGADRLSTGYAVDLAEELAKAMGVRLRLVQTAANAEEVIAQITADEADVAICYLTPTPVRALRVWFSEPYLYVPMGVLIHPTAVRRFVRDTVHPQEMNDVDFTGVRLTMDEESRFSSYFFPNVRMDSLSSDRLVKTYMQSGQYDVFLGNELALYRLRESDDLFSDSLSMKLFDADPIPLCMVVPKGATHLLSFVNLFIRKLPPQPNLKELLSKYPITRTIVTGGE